MLALFENIRLFMLPVENYWIPAKRVFFSSLVETTSRKLLKKRFSSPFDFQAVAAFNCHVYDFGISTGSFVESELIRVTVPWPSAPTLFRLFSLVAADRETRSARCFTDLVASAVVFSRHFQRSYSQFLLCTRTQRSNVY